MSQTQMYKAQIETISREDLTQLQIERMQSTLNRVYRNVAFYRTAFDSYRVNLERLKDLDRLRELPFTTREDLRKSYPYNMFAVPLRDIVRIHSTSGTTDRPIVIGYTRSDLRNWTECAARVLTAAGITEQDVVQIALDFNLFSEGFGFHQGAEQIGASVIPASLTTSVKKQIVLMKDFKTSVLISTPSHTSNIAAEIEKLQVHPEGLHLRLGLFCGDRWTEAIRRQIEQRLRILFIDTYGLTEIMSPGIAGECSFRQGLHINEDHFIAEIIDPKTLQPVEAGQEGELVLTTITKEGFPLIRYRTGDMTSLNLQPCPCGRTLARMARVTARSDDLILFNGIGFYPSQIEKILLSIEGTSPHYQIILDRKDGIDTLSIKVEISDSIPGLDEVRVLETLRSQIYRRIKTALDLEARIVFVEPKSLHRETDSRQRVIDRRLENKG